MQIVLLERIAKLGQMGDVVNVKDGYARNFLLPQGKALRANKANLERFERDRAQLEAANLERKSEAEAVFNKLDGESIIIIRQSGDTGQLYGSVNSRDIAEALGKAGFTLMRNQITLDRPIKTLGMHNVVVVLHPEVSALIQVNVARTEDEAARQARGETVLGEATAPENMEDATDDHGEDMAEDMFEAGAQPAQDDADETANASDIDGEADSNDVAEATPVTDEH